jgi:Myelodysplasia-myeloid leukemia factor 1-interacting protein
MRQMRHMTNQMMRGDPFGGFGLFGGMRIPSIMDMGAGSHSQHLSLMPHMNMNMNMNHGFPDMSRLLAVPQGSTPGVSYSSSSVFCMSSNGNGQPQIYKETSSMRAGPNGVRETRRTVEGTYYAYTSLSAIIMLLILIY